MSMLPEVKCRRCGQSFSALRTSCPNCGTRRVVQSGRTPNATPAMVKGTPANERAETNTRWQMIFGLILVVAVILAVVVMVSTSLNGLDNQTTTTRRSRSTPTPIISPTVDPQLFIETPPTPSPTPTPTVESIKIFFFEKELTAEAGGFTMHMGEDPLTITARAYPADQFSDATFKWSTPDSDCLKLTPGEDGKSCECAILQAKAGGTSLTVSCFGKEYTIPVYLVN